MAETAVKDKAKTEDEFIVPPPVENAALAVREHVVDREPQFAKRQTIWSSLPETQKNLLRAKSSNLDDNERASAMELAVAYGLDPYTGEIWFTKSEPRNGNAGKLLIMVGRDGLRKIVMRNHMDMRGDVIHQNDQFSVIHEPDRTTKVRHAYEHPAKRGDITGAWAEVWNPRTGQQKGFFYASFDQYVPTNLNQYTPWAKQKSVMILAAAERQAARQATPLGGLLVEGEDDTINSATAEFVEVDENEARQESTLPAEALAIVDRARELDFGGFDIFTVDMILTGASDEQAKTWVESATFDLDEFEHTKKIDAVNKAWQERHVEFMARGQALKDALVRAEADGDEEAATAAREAGGVLTDEFTAARTEVQAELDALAANWIEKHGEGNGAA